MLSVFQAILTVTQDYSEIKKAETKGEKYDVTKMKKRYMDQSLKDIKKMFGGDMIMISSFVGYITSYDVHKHSQVYKFTIIEDLLAYKNKFDKLPTEQITGPKGKQNMLLNLIPFFNSILKYLLMNEESLKKEMIEERKGKDFDIKAHTFHLEGFTSTSFDRNIAEEFACKRDWPGKKSVIMEYVIKLDNNRYPGFQLNRPEYTAYPEENEFLLMDGADCIIKNVKEDYV